MGASCLVLPLHARARRVRGALTITCTRRHLSFVLGGATDCNGLAYA